MSYGDDQCEECGGVRVARSFLCADCLVTACARERQKKESLQRMVDKAILEIAKYNSRLEEAIRYGFKQNQENIELNQRILGLYGKIREVMEDAKNRQRENKKG